MKEDVKRVLREEQPLKGREIAKRIGQDRRAVNAFLDTNRDTFTQNDAFEWSILQTSELVVEFPDVDWLTAEDFETALCEHGSPLDSEKQHVIFKVSSKLLIDALARLLAICNQAVARGKLVTIDLSDCKQTAKYLNRIGFFDLLAPSISVSPERPQTSLAAKHKGGNANVMELAAISMDERDDEIPRRLISCFREVAGDEHPTRILTILGELFDNVHEHSQSLIPGFAALQAYKKGRFPNIRAVISDSGAGIVGTLLPVFNSAIATTGRDVREALIEHVFSHGRLSRVDEAGRGLGLKRTGDFANKFNAVITVRQEDFEATIRVRDDELAFKHRHGLTKMLGTHICLTFALTS
ncbi:hypothetical protein PQR71_06810 [Paraburkholderia fungorum]|uniref:hypothetical protein n=1 Tax=Paraburkholderia fungorum TaxID=134537 RepID=UPI0038B8191A